MFHLEIEGVCQGDFLVLLEPSLMLVKRLRVCALDRPGLCFSLREGVDGLLVRVEDPFFVIPLVPNLAVFYLYAQELIEIGHARNLQGNVV